MQRFLTTFFISLAVVTGIAVYAPVAFAQNTAQSGTQGSIQEGPPAPGALQPGIVGSTQEGPPAPSSASTQDLKTASGIPLSLQGSGAPTDAAYSNIMTKIASLFAWLLGVAIITLDYTVYYTVVTMGDLVHKLSAVGVAWRILRDIGNIVLIFGFLAIGISIILNTEKLGYGQKMLPMLIIAAISLNFSLFISEAVIDTGNLFATEFYAQINGGTLPTPATLANLTVSNEGISNKIMDQLGLQRIYGAAVSDVRVLQFNGSWLIGFMSIFLFLVTAFVMFSLAFILIARFVILIFLIIVAPIGFAGLAVPKLEGVAHQWWSYLFEQTITAPILLLMLYIALAVITDAQFLTGFGVKGSDAWSGFIETGNLTGFAGILLSFLVAMGLLLGVTILAKKLSAFGGAWAMKMGGKLSFGATAWAGRSSGGWLANKGANFARRTWIGRVPLAGTGLVRGLDRVATSSFDIRSTSGLKNLPFGGIDAGTAQKGGYKAELKSRIESRTKYAGELKGRELTNEEKAKQALLLNQIKGFEKQRDNATSEAEIRTASANIKRAEADLEKIEGVTDKGAQRKYAKVLLLGGDKDNWFNKHFNFTANTEAAKKIRADAKKSSDDKTLEALVKKAAKEETPPSGPPPPGSP